MTLPYLERPGARVVGGDGIGVVAPHVLEHTLKVLVRGLQHVALLFLSKHTETEREASGY